MVTESYRAAPFQGWSVSPLLPVRSTAKKPQPHHGTPGARKSHPSRAGIAKLPGRDRRQDRGRKAPLIRPGPRRGSAAPHPPESGQGIGCRLPLNRRCHWAQCFEKTRKLNSQKIANMARARKMCGQGPFFAGVSPALSCLIFLARRMFPTTKHAPLAKRNTGSGVLPGSVYPVTAIPASIPSSMNTIVDLFNEKHPLRTLASENP